MLTFKFLYFDFSNTFVCLFKVSVGFSEFKCIIYPFIMALEEKNRSKIYILNDIKLIESNNLNEYFSMGIINDDIYHWEVIIFGPKGTVFENGIFRAEMKFPTRYPDEPPTFKFITKMWHPNIDKEGNVCISILHKPGNDDYGYESINERWMPVRSAESVIMSIICLLSSPNCESSANHDAGMQYRDDFEGYNRKVRNLSQKTLEEF